ncbi:MAG: N-6 DNA methylase [Spirochaetales bacterium]|nr:N-6 DNA methylase [Spirochaetales bacterium]
MTDSAIISKIWNLANVLRDDGVGYGDYLEQITYLLFLKMADELSKPPYNKDLKFPRLKDVEGKEIVASIRRMCLMNMYLHNIGEIDGDSFLSANDALISDNGVRYDYVLANPPFGKKSSMTITNESGEVQKEDLSYNRQDFWETSSNKQLNFQPHIKTQLKITGEAAVVLPDNVLFEGGAGEEVRKQLMKTTETWSEQNPEGRWRRFSYEEILARDKTNLDIFWLKDKSLTDLDNLPDPDILANEIIENIESGLNAFRDIMETINGTSGE